MRSKEYASNLSNEQWRLIQKVLPNPKKRGRKPIDRRQVINAILYWNRTGCQWRYLRAAFPTGVLFTVCFAVGELRTWQRIHDQLREWVRASEGKKPTPTVAIIDSQSVKPQKVANNEITMRERRLRVASGTSQWILWDCYLSSWCMLRVFKITKGHTSYCTASRISSVA